VEKSEESKHSAEDYSSKSNDVFTESSNDSGYVKGTPLIFVLWQLQHRTVDGNTLTVSDSTLTDHS
jgi:hypothetical protein